MKKLFLFALMIPALLVSCDDTKEGHDGKGSIRVGPSVDVKTNAQSRATPTTEFSTYWITLQGPTTKTVAWPEGGIISDLNVGDYTVIVASHQEMPAPAFDTQYYVGQEDNVRVNPGQTTSVDMTAYQANAGIYFSYDATLSSFDIIPTLTQGSNSLVYSGANKEATGYFAPGEVVITLKNGTEQIKIDGASSKTITVEAKQLWKINLTADAVEDGSINITVTVEVIDTATNEVTFQVGEGGDPGTGLEIPDLNYTMLPYGSAALYADDMDLYDTALMSVEIMQTEDAKNADILFLNMFANWPTSKNDLYAEAEGVWEVGENEAPLTFYPGIYSNNKLEGSYLIQTNEEARYYSAQSYLVQMGGKVYIKKTGDSYTLATDLIGKQATTGEEKVMRYKIEGLQIIDMHVPKGNLNPATVPTGNYSGSGIPSWLTTPGDANWTGVVNFNDDDPTEIYWLLSNIFNRGGSYCLDLFNDNLIITPDFMIWNTSYAYACVAYYIKNGTPEPYSHYMPKLNGQTIDFTGTVAGYDVYIGLMAYDRSTGASAGLLSDLYKNAKVTVSSTPSATSNEYYSKSVIKDNDKFTRFEGPTGLRVFKNNSSVKGTGIPKRMVR